MNRSKVVPLMLVIAFGAFLLASSVVALYGQEKGEIKRNVLTKQDLASVPGHEGVLGQVEIAPGAAEGKHTHPGELFGYVQEGTLTLNIEGKPAKTVKQGESFFIPAEAVHWGENQSQTPVKVLATMVIPKGKPATSPAK